MATALNQTRPQSLQGGGQRQLLRLPRRPPCAYQSGGNAQAAVQQRSPRIPLQRGGHPGEKAAAQVTAQHPQRQCSQRGAQCQTQGTAHQPQGQRFPQHQRQPLARAQAQHAQQSQLLRAFAHAQGQHRKHQKSPGEQGDQRQHRQIDPVGA